MHHHHPGDEFSFVTHTEKGLSMLVDGFKERELLMKRDQIISSILEDAPRSFTKLVFKDVYGREVKEQERGKGGVKYGGGHSAEVRSRHNQKTFFRALEEEQKHISRENMQLLGLTIQKIGSVSKAKRTGEVSEPLINTVQPEVLNLQNNENIPQSEQLQQLVDKKLMMLPRKVRTMTKRPQSIRLRRKQSTMSPQRRRSSMKPVNPEYQNAIYDGRIQSYRELLFKLQWSYGLYSEMDGQEQFKSDRKYKVWIGNGNNSPLIRELMRRRFWWQIVEDRGNMEVNFVWTQLRVMEYLQKQGQAALWFLNQGVRKPEEKEKEFCMTLSKDLSRELKLRSKSKKDKDREKEQMKDEDNLGKIMPAFEIASYQTSIRSHRLKPIYERQSLLNLKQSTTEGERIHNHLTSNFHLGNKKALFYNLKEYYELTNGSLFKVLPLTFHIKKGMKDPEYKRFLAYHKKRQGAVKRQEREIENGQTVKRPLRNIWIVKPGELTNRGHGITVIDEVYELDSIIKSQKRHENGNEKTFIVQLYIDRPLLYKRRKFDIRHFMMITQIHGVFKAFWFKEGYIRTSSYDFDVYNFDRQIHLTNDSVQKNMPLYGRHEPANKVSYAQFQKYLDGHYKDKERYNFEDGIVRKMKEIALDSVRSVFTKISPERKKHNFEIFGLDFMIDGHFNPWLIEINTNPCLELSCPLLTRIVPQMLDQALRLTLDVVYPPPTHYPNTTKHLVPDASLQNLRWQLIFDERIEGQKIRQLYRKSQPDLMAEIGDMSQEETFEDSNHSQVNLQQELF